jgi:hypothetical protein
MAPGELTSPLPAEFRADGVTTFTAPDASLAAVIEIQSASDDDKRWVWPAYLALARARHNCPTVLLVICPDQATSRWARQPIATGHPGFDLAPLVIDAATTPPPGPPGAPGPGPELAVLGVLTGAIDLDHDSGRHQVLGILAAAGLEEDQLETYTHLIRAVASAAARQALEALMTTTFKDDFVDRIKAEGKAGTVLRILAARGFEVPGSVRDLVLSCTDLAKLDQWAETAVTAASLEDIFAGDR